MVSLPSPTPRLRRAYDHRLREHVVRSGARSLARHVAIPRSTVSTWQRRGLRPVVTIEPLEQERQHLIESIVKLDLRARVLAAVVRLLLVLVRSRASVLPADDSPRARPRRMSSAPSRARNLFSLSLSSSGSFALNRLGFMLGAPPWQPVSSPIALLVPAHSRLAANRALACEACLAQHVGPTESRIPP